MCHTKYAESRNFGKPLCQNYCQLFSDDEPSPKGVPFMINIVAASLNVPAIVAICVGAFILLILLLCLPIGTFFIAAGTAPAAMR